MKRTVRNRVKLEGSVRTTIVTITTQHEWELKPTSHQLPCGCIGPNIWSSDELQESECTDCGRGWRHMCATGPGSKGVYGSHAFCVMLDGKPQGEPVLVLGEKMMIAE